jgi:hypothetical protein
MRNVIIVIVILLGVSVAPAQPPKSVDRAMPGFDIERSCKTLLAMDPGIGETLASCEADEEWARDELIPQWSRFRSADRRSCMREMRANGSPSYVELLTCLELSAQRS